MKPTRICVGLGLCACALTAQASQLIYQPTSPSFGGHPSNGTFLMNQAQAQNTFRDPNARDPFAANDPAANFQQNLDRLILNRLSNQIYQETFMTEDGEFGPGVYYGDGFVMEVVRNETTGQMEFTLTNTNTGERVHVGSNPQF